MKNVLLIKGVSQYNAMRNYIDEIEVGFRLAGYNTIILDGKQGSFDFQVEQLIESVKIDYVFTCNAIIPEICGKLPEAVYVTYLCDYPAVHRERLSALKENAIVFTLDAAHAEYIKTYCDNIKHTMFVPLSGSYSKKYVPYEERTKEIVFTGSYTNPEQTYNEALARFRGTLKGFVEHMLRSIVENPSQSLEVCLEDMLKRVGAAVSKQEFHKMMTDFSDIDAYARNYYRDKVIRVLIENGLKVHVYGNGWEKFESKSAENLIIEKGNFYVAQKAVADAKISLNVMPWFKEGFQERIATAMLSGTVALTDESGYINRNFVDGRELVTYSLDNLSELPFKVKQLLNDNALAMQIAAAGKELAENSMTWQHRTFVMIDFIEACTGNRTATGNNQYGNIIRIPYKKQNNRSIAIEAVNDIEEILEMLSHIQQYDKLEICDIQYLYTRFLYLYMRIKDNFPTIEISDFVYNYLMNITEDNIQNGIELLILQCTNIQSVFLKTEYRVLKQEKRPVAMSAKPNAHSQEVLIRKILKNYEASTDEEIIEIMESINKSRYVDAYNQRFVSKYAKLTRKNLEAVYYDRDAGMHYVMLNGKKMYYPPSHSKESVASEINFVNLEQDEESPHRYLDESFSIKDGDIVVDAGVTEGNFALEIVEKAKKIYLVECNHEWVKALKKTFEPWKEKVVIVEKMLGAVDDDEHVSIDGLVEEDEINFIKMDVEGAEVDSLKGAARVLSNSTDIKCAICAYHRKNAERDIREILESHKFFTTTTKGYMFFKEDMDSWVDGELRRGIVRAVKQ